MKCICNPVCTSKRLREYTISTYVASGDKHTRTSNHTSTSSCRYFSSYVRCRHSIIRASPIVASLNTTNPTPPSIIAVRDAHRLISDTLTSVRSRLKTLGADHRTCTDGSTHNAYHPHLTTDYTFPDYADLFDDARADILKRCKQRQLTAVFNIDAWIEVKTKSDEFDTTNLAATLPHREATRLASCSQEGSGAFRMRLPDTSLKSSIRHSTDFRTACQRDALASTSLPSPTPSMRGNDAAPTSHSNTALAMMPSTALTPH